MEGPCGQAFCDDVRRTIQLLEFLVATFSLFEDAKINPKNSSNVDFAKIAPLIKYIPANIAEPLSLDSLSAQFFFDKYHMCHIFKSATGFSVMEYIIHCRVLKARELLRQGLRVQEVGERVGFRNNAHFIRTFGALTGTSPKRYAKKYLLGEKA